MRARTERERQEHAAARGRRPRRPSDRARALGRRRPRAAFRRTAAGSGSMFQDHALFPHRDVLGNVAFGLRMQRRAARRGRSPRAERAARRSSGSPASSTGGSPSCPAASSSASRSARALAPAPRLLMLDEPLGALDRALRERLVAELRALFVRLGLTIALRDPRPRRGVRARRPRRGDARRAASSRSARPAEVWDHPANAFVARFLGWNVTGALGDGRGRGAPRGPAARPARTAPIAGVVTGRTFRRDHFLVEVEVDDGPSLEVAATGDRIPAAGDPVRLAVDPAAIVALRCRSPGRPSRPWHCAAIRWRASAPNLHNSGKTPRDAFLILECDVAGSCARRSPARSSSSRTKRRSPTPWPPGSAARASTSRSPPTARPASSCASGSTPTSSCSTSCSPASTASTCAGRSSATGRFRC